MQVPFSNAFFLLAVVYLFSSRQTKTSLNIRLSLYNVTWQKLWWKAYYAYITLSKFTFQKVAIQFLISYHTPPNFSKDCFRPKVLLIEVTQYEKLIWGFRMLKNMEKFKAFCWNFFSSRNWNSEFWMRKLINRLLNLVFYH